MTSGNDARRTFNPRIRTLGLVLPVFLVTAFLILPRFLPHSTGEAGLGAAVGLGLLWMVIFTATACAEVAIAVHLFSRGARLSGIVILLIGLVPALVLVDLLVLDTGFANRLMGLPRHPGAAERGIR